MPLWMLLATAILSLPVASQRAARFELVDEGTGNAELMKVRALAVAAIAARDPKRLAALMTRDVAFDPFGPNPRTGPRALIAQYELDKADSPVWDDLAAILRSGGRLHLGPGFEMPFVAGMPDISVEFEWCVAMGVVSVRTGPSLATPEAAVLVGDLVPIVGTRSNDFWKAIRYDAKGSVGFVPRASCRNGHDLRVYFTKTAQGWKISSIIGGD